MKRFASQVMASALLLSGTGLVGAATLPIPPDWRYEGRGEANVKAEVSKLLYDGAYAPVLKINATADPAGAVAPPNGIIRQTFNPRLFGATLAEYGVLTFKAKFNATGTAKPEITVQMVSPGVNLSQSFSPTEGATPAKDGFYSFRWDFGKDPKVIGKKGALSELRFSVNAGGYQPTDALEVAIIDLVLEGDGPSKNIESRVPPSEWKMTGPVTKRDVPVVGWSAGAGVRVENTSVLLAQKQQPALRLTFKKAEKIGVVSLPFPANADKENVFTFKAKVVAPQGSKQLGNIQAPMTGWYSQQFNAFTDNFGVAMQDKYGQDWASLGVPTTHFLQHLDPSVPEVDGFRTFRWDMKNENPTGNKGFDLQDVAAVKFVYDGRRLQPGQETVVTILAPQFVSGQEKTGGDETAFGQYREYRSTYRPDYSNSAKYLKAPEKGRLPKALSLVKDGKAQGEIVGAAGPWTPEGNAVLELYRWTYRLSGAQLPVMAKPTATDNIKVFVGAAYAQEFFAADLAALKDSDGCAIRTRGNNVYIFGATGKGTLNGVYTFLEGNSDIIWPHPSEMFGAVYTESSNFDIAWGDYIHRTPARNWGWMGTTSGSNLGYQIHNRANYVGLRSGPDFKYWGLYKEEGGGHNLHSWIPFSLFKTHPEYWAMIDGERQYPNAYKNQICLSNEEGRAIFIKSIRSLIDRTPEARTADCFNIKIEDNWGVCECPECRRPIRLPDGTLLGPDDIAFRSTQFFMFLNGVANALHNDGLPKLQIGTYVYFFTVPPPKVPVTSYLRPYLCDYVRKDHKVPIYAPINDIWWRVLNDWAQVSDKVVMREYTGLMVYFRPMAEVASRDIQAELKAGVYEFTSESLPNGTSQAPSPANEQMDAGFMEYWLINRLYWDPEADVEQLRKYFIRRTFHKAAPEMEKFYGTIRQAYFAEQRATDFEENHETIRLIIRQGKEEELRNYLRQAAKKADHPLSKRLVALIATRFDQWTTEVKTATP